MPRKIVRSAHNTSEKVQIEFLQMLADHCALDFHKSRNRIISCDSQSSKMRSFALWVIVLITLGMSGCGDEEPIRKYTVSKKDVNRAKPIASVATGPKQEKTMWGAIVPNEPNAWFFKLADAPDKVDSEGADFRTIVDSVKFGDAGVPTWDLSDGWTQQIVQGITYAKLKQEDSGVEATVTSLPILDDDWDKYVWGNVNRWRKQLSLPPEPWESMVENLEEVPSLSDGTKKAYFVKLEGKGTGAMGGAPFMNQFGGQTEAAPKESKPAEKPEESKLPKSSLMYVVPDGWDELEASGMRRASFSVKSDESSGEVSVIAAGGSIDANIGLWIGQVGREATEEAKKEVISAGENVAVNEVDSMLYTIDGAEGESILIAEVPWKSGESLFIKLKGASELVEAQRFSYLEYLESLTW